MPAKLCESLVVTLFTPAHLPWILLPHSPWLAVQRGTPIINSLVGEIHQPWLATYLGEGNSEFKPILRGICWHCPSLLGHGSWISCYFLSRGAQFGLSGCDVSAFSRWFSTTFLKIVVEVVASRLPKVC